MSNEIKKSEKPEQEGTAIEATLPAKAEPAEVAVVPREQMEIALAPDTVRKTLRKVDTPIKAFKSDMPTLATLTKDYGEGFCKNRLYLMLLSLGDYLGGQFDLDKRQLAMLSEEILDEFYAINFADVNLVLKRIKHGECGKIYGKINCAYIYDAFRSYYQERTAAIAESHRASEESIAKHGYDRTATLSATEEQVAELYERYRKAYEAKKEQEAQIHLSAQIHLKDVLNKVKNHVKNGTKENM